MNRERLLNVARALRESPNPEKFDMGMYGRTRHECETPACAFGHYAHRQDLQDVFVLRRADIRLAATGEQAGAFSDEALEHFAINEEQSFELFDQDGCGGAKTAIEAAEYIEDFVARGGK